MRASDTGCGPRWASLYWLNSSSKILPFVGRGIYTGYVMPYRACLSAAVASR